MISSKRAYGYFRDTFMLKPSTKGWFAFECPRCAKTNKGAVHFDYELVKCWVCEYKEGLVDFVATYEGIPFKESLRLLNTYTEAEVDFRLLEGEYVVKEVDVKLPEHFVGILDGEGVLGDRAREYLKGRGLGLKLCAKLGLGYVNKHAEKKEDDYFGYIIIPFKRNGNLYYYTARDYTGNYLRYKNPAVSDFGIGKSELLFNEDVLMGEEAFLTEGWACAVTMRNGAALGGLSMSSIQKSKIIESPCERIVIATDAGFYKSGIKIGMELLDHKEVYVLNLDKLSEFGKDPNEIGRDRVMDLYANTPRLTFGSAIGEML